MLYWRIIDPLLLHYHILLLRAVEFHQPTITITILVIINIFGLFFKRLLTSIYGNIDTFIGHIDDKTVLIKAFIHDDDTLYTIKKKIMVYLNKLNFYALIKRYNERKLFCNLLI